MIEGDFDYIVVGGGSAGCVMASRLSESASNRVLLIEAGRNYEPGAEPAGMRDPAAAIFFHPQYFKFLPGEGASATEGGAPSKMPVLQANVMGGGSAINGMHAQRGEPDDYDEYRQLGVTGWGWEDVLPFFKKVETDVDFQGPAHGGDGPIKIKRQGSEHWSALSRAVSRVLEEDGVPRIDDLNDHSGAGYGAVPLNAVEQRMSSAAAYLTTEVRARKNLRILAQTKVRRLLFEGPRVRGVELMDKPGTTIRGANVVVCCGAYLSPELLLRSGVGPARALEQAGVQVVADRPGVGRNFQNHAQMGLFAHLARAGRRQAAVRASCLMVARLSSNIPSCPPSDLIFNLWERAPGSAMNNPIGHQFADFMMILNKPYSMGEIALDAEKPDGPVKIRTNLLSDRRDLDRMVEGFRYLAKLAQADEVSPMLNDVFALKPSLFLMLLMQENIVSRGFSVMGGLTLDGPATLRRFLLKKSITPLADLLKEPGAIEAQVRRDCAPTHSVGTCRLGDPAAADTVVDEHCRVVGVENLRVVDASIFPRCMRAGTNLPVMMAAEKAARSISLGH